MLLLYFFLLSCCLSVSMGSGAIEEFEDNFKNLAKIGNNEIFLQVPKGRFECSCVHHYLRNTMGQLKSTEEFKNEPATKYIFLMENNMAHIIKKISIKHREREADSSCQMKEVSLSSALRHYKRFFEKLNEKNHCA